VTKNILKIKINNNKLYRMLGGKNIRWLHSKLKEKGIDIGYNALCSNIRNDVEWKLIYAYYICEILNCKIEDLFYIE
jgi:hypothetical protein